MRSSWVGWHEVEIPLSLSPSQVTVAQYLPTNPLFAPSGKTGMLVSHQILYNHSWILLTPRIPNSLFKAPVFIHLLGLTTKCLICPNMSGTEIKLSSISREFYQKETINVPVNKQTYLLYSHACHSPEIVNSRKSVGNLDNLSVKMAKTAKSHSLSIISAYFKHNNLLHYKSWKYHKNTS